MTTNALPVAVIGAGPVGLAAAAHLADRKLPFVVLEAGTEVGANVVEWGHVQFFSPWRYTLDPTAQRLLMASGWTAPDPDDHPTGTDIVGRYLRPLAQLPALRDSIRRKHRVVAVGRMGLDKMRNADRDEQPFTLTVAGPSGRTRILARAVIDATGTWQTPNPLGADGIPARGEDAFANRIFSGIPDVLGTARERYANRRVAVVGSGHSAQNAVRDLAMLQISEPATTITWVVRRSSPGQMFGGGDDDQLPERGRLGSDSHMLIDSGQVRLETGFAIEALTAAADGGVMLESMDGSLLGPFDEVVAATGFRPDLVFLRELRLDLDPTIESTRTLAPMIDPNFHSCGSVPPHGEAELRHPEANVYLVGMKSYGRAPSFLLATGYEQVRSVVAHLAGDEEAARRVELILPETGVCSSEPSLIPVASAASCCEPPRLGSAIEASACCG